MRITDHRYHRDIRRYQLARRLIRHEARTQTVCEWTGLSDERVRNFLRAYCVGDNGTGTALRHRGPPPQRLTAIFWSARIASEAAALAGLARVTGIEKEPGLANGERLCHLFEIFRACLPDTSLTLE